jgi:acetyltransferase-like isoleucine patch superfamily enzyme
MNVIEDYVDISSLAKVTNTALKIYARVKDYAEVRESVVGEYSYVSQQSIVNKTNIGKFVSIANGCYVGLWEHNTEVSTHSFYLYEHSGHFVKGYKNYTKDIIETNIGNDVWIGANSVILKGVTIGSGAIIGAGSVVTKDVPPYSIVVGNSAKVLKYRYSQKEIEWLLDLKWWDFDRERIQELVDANAFSSFERFKELLKFEEKL